MPEGYVKKDTLFVAEMAADDCPDIYLEPAILGENSVYLVLESAHKDFNCRLLRYIGELHIDGYKDPTKESYKLIDTDFKTMKRRYYKVVLDYEEDVSDDEIEEVSEEDYQQA